MVFPVIMYGCENWTIKKAEHRIIDAFELWFWIRLLGVPWTTRRSNQSILNKISLGCSLEGVMLKLKLQYFDHLMQRADSFEKTDSGNDWRQEEKGTTEDEMVEWHHRLNGHGFGWTPGVGDVQGGLSMLWFMGSQKVGHDWATGLNWTLTAPFQLSVPFPTPNTLSSLSLSFSLSIFLSFFFYISLPVFLYFPSIVIYTVYFPWVLHIHGFHMGRWPVLHCIQIRNPVDSVGFLPNLSTRDDWTPILE